MPPLFYPSHQTIALARVIFDEIRDHVDGFVEQLGGAWYWRLPAGTLVTFRLDYTVTEERWDVIRAQATNPRVGTFNSADFPFAMYATSPNSPPYIHDMKGLAEWSNRLYFNMGDLINDAIQWMEMLKASVLAPQVTPPAAFPHLNKLERAIIRHTIDELDGRFHLGKLYDAFGERISRRRLSNLAQDWESLGLLTSHPRRVTYALQALVEADE